MPLVTSKKMLLDAQKGGYAVGAFNVENMEMVKAVIAAAEELNAPVILQTTPSTVKYGSLETYAAIVAAEAKKATVPVCLHLDHGNSYELAMAAIEAGYSSVMIDGSHESLENNIAITKKVVEDAEKKEIPVEAELGKVGGKEDGFYAGTPVLDKERVSEIKALVSVPLVLHGASGLSNEEIKECVNRGMCKVNFATELRVAYTDAVKRLLEEKPETFDPKKIGEVGMLAVKELAVNRMKVCGCVNKGK